MARDWNGTTDIIDLGSGATIDDVFIATNGSTIFAWCFPDTIGESSAGQLFWKANGTTQGNNIPINTTSKFKFNSFRATTTGTWIQTNNDGVLDAWNSLSIKYDGTSTTNDPTFCHNGTIQTVGSGLTESSTPVGTQGSDAAITTYLGNNTANTGTWDGYISHVTIWKGEVLGNNQMQAMSRGANPFAIGSSTKPVLFIPIWGNDSPEFDLSGNNNDGTLTGTTRVSASPPVEHMSNYISGYC